MNKNNKNNKENILTEITEKMDSLVSLFPEIETSEKRIIKIKDLVLFSIMDTNEEYFDTARTHLAKVLLTFGSIWELAETEWNKTNPKNETMAYEWAADYIEEQFKKVEFWNKKVEAIKNGK